MHFQCRSSSRCKIARDSRVTDRRVDRSKPDKRRISLATSQADRAVSACQMKALDEANQQRYRIGSGPELPKLRTSSGHDSRASRWQIYSADNLRFQQYKRYTARRRQYMTRSASHDKQVWIETSDKAAFTAALEAGATSFLFQPSNESLASEWQSIAKFTAIMCRSSASEEGQDPPVSVVRINSKQDLAAAEAQCTSAGTVVMDASDWQIIPAENLVAAFQGQPAALFGVAKSAKDAKILLEALEIGTDGVVLRTDDAAEVRQALQYLRETTSLASQILALKSATVTRIEQLGMGDRVAVDLCSLMVPGEGLLVGSFARGLFLVQSECSESSYINSRPFRINCGPVHSYAAMPGGKTAYLSELKSGMEVLITDSSGKQRIAIVGRVKIETRPLVLVEAKIGEDDFSIILQNAETVRLICPDRLSEPGQLHEQPARGAHSVSVTDLQEGDAVLLHQQEGARHTGVAIKENILEK